MDSNLQGYYQRKKIPLLFEALLAGLSYHRPEDHLHFLQQALEEIKRNPNTPLRWDRFLKETENERTSRLRAALPRAFFDHNPSDPVFTTLNGVTPTLHAADTPVRMKQQALLKGSDPATWQKQANVVFVLGGPGSGKGTQCGKLVNEFGMSHISVGDLLRAEVARETVVGREIHGMIKEGKIVPLNITLKVVENALKDINNPNGVLLDGFPREMAQAIEFEKQIGRAKFVLYFDCPEYLMKNRVLRRGETSGRADDNAEALEKRIRTFLDQSVPVVNYFEKQGRLMNISSEPPTEEVYQKVRSLFTREPEKKANVVLVLGGPGSGKGTQCAKLVQEFGLSHVSVGDLMRAEVARGSPDGKEIDAMMKEGKIVPLHITLKVVEKGLKEINNPKGVLLDGFPREMAQAIEFEKLIGKPKFALYFECTNELLEKRLLKRGETSGRADDNAEAIKKRFKTFLDQSLPVTEWYAKQGRLVKISSEPPIEEVYQQVRQHFAPPPPKNSNVVFVLGGPGSGKGTQCAKIVEEFGLSHVSVGDLMRAEVAKGSEHGKEIDGMMKEGKIVPLDITLKVVEKGLKEINNPKGVLLDGFPREMAQAIEFEKLIGKAKFALYFECTNELLEKRLLKRGETSGRADDNAEAIKKRFKTFLEQSLPVTDWYAKQGRLVKISSEPPIDEVYQQVRRHFLPAPEKQSNVVFVLGGPGSGKGTQCAKIVEEFGLSHVSVGDLMRAEVAKGSSDGKEIEEMMKEGKIVPLQITLKVVEKGLKEINNPKGVLLDGFPREMAQAIEFEKLIGKAKFALYFECTNELLEKRLLKRGETSGRADDNAEAIKKRFKTFLEQSLPVTEWYAKQGRLVKISSEPPIDEVYQQVRAHFAK